MGGSKADMWCDKDVNVSRAFVLTANSFRGLVKALNLGENIKFTVKCRDGSTLHPKSCDDIFELPNPKSRAITAIALTTPYGSNPSLSVEFSDSEYYPISYSIEGEDSDVCSYSALIEQHLEPMSRWYSLLYGNPFKRGTMTAALFMFGFVFCMVGGAGLVKYHFEGQQHTLLFIAFIFIGLLGLSFEKLSWYYSLQLRFASVEA